MPVNPKDSANFLKEKRRLEEDRFDSLWQLATNDASRMVEHIATNYPVTHIYQWGSLLDQEKFRDYSDIDLAVVGLHDPQLFFSLLSELETMSVFPVDIVQLEKIESVYCDSILKNGKLVYER